MKFIALFIILIEYDLPVTLKLLQKNLIFNYESSINIAWIFETRQKRENAFALAQLEKLQTGGCDINGQA